MDRDLGSQGAGSNHRNLADLGHHFCFSGAEKGLKFRSRR
jgi:hypothetical protein